MNIHPPVTLLFSTLLVVSSVNQIHAAKLTHSFKRHFNIKDASCSGSGVDMLCAVAADDVSFYSTDGGLHWNDIPYHRGFPEYMKAVSCKKTATNAVCLLGGYEHYGTNTKKDFGVLQVYRNGTPDWPETSYYYPIYPVQYIYCIGPDLV